MVQNVLIPWGQLSGRFTPASPQELHILIVNSIFICFLLGIGEIQAFQVRSNIAEAIRLDRVLIPCDQHANLGQSGSETNGNREWSRIRQLAQERDVLGRAHFGSRHGTAWDQVSKPVGQ